MAAAVHEMWMGTFTTRDGSGSSGANAQRGTCAASPGPFGKGRCDTVVGRSVPAAALLGWDVEKGSSTPLAPTAARGGGGPE